MRYAAQDGAHLVGIAANVRAADGREGQRAQGAPAEGIQAGHVALQPAARLLSHTSQYYNSALSISGFSWCHTIEIWV